VHSHNLKKIVTKCIHSLIYYNSIFSRT